MNNARFWMQSTDSPRDTQNRYKVLGMGKLSSSMARATMVPVMSRELAIVSWNPIDIVFGGISYKSRTTIHGLDDLIGEAVWLVSVSCVRPEELVFKWIDLDAKNRMLWVVRAVNRGKLHTPKYHRSNRPIRLTRADVDRLLALKQKMKAKDEDWMFPNSRKTGPIWHEDLLARRIQPVAEELGLPHITLRLLRHWGATQMVEARVPLKAAQERLGHSRPDILLKFYAHVLDASADMAAEILSGQFGSGFSSLTGARAADYPGS